jgi:hypothetical protein
MKRRTSLLALVLVFGSACSSDPSGAPPVWSQVEQSQDVALTSVHGTSAEDVWMAGADDGNGPVVLHWDGHVWERRTTPVRGDLWWVHAVGGGPVFFGGADANIVRYEGGSFERMATPGLGKHIVFGIWAAGPSDVYAVGSAAGRNGFIWHYDGQSWQELPEPSGLPEDEYFDVPAFFKVWGTSADDVWIVGGRGLVLRGNAQNGFQVVRSGVEDTLFTVHAAGGRVLMVGGGNQGVILEAQGNELVNRTPANAPLLQGVTVAADGTAWATGLGGSIYRSDGQDFEPVDPGIDFKPTQSLHSTWIDPSGGQWSVGGNVLSPPLAAGIAVHLGALLPQFRIDPVMPPVPSCPADAIDPAPGGSIARRWDEQLLNAIRRDLPRPTVHARNLFHAAVAMWDAWAAYDQVAKGYVVQERRTAADADAERREAISYAAYRVLSHRYATAVSGAVSQACFDAFMGLLGYDPADKDASGAGPRAFGNRVGAAVIDAFAGDGANEATNYAPSTPYTSTIPNLVVDSPGTRTTDPLGWQKLVIAQAVTQNGIPLGSAAQDYVGPHWGTVTPFALARPAPDEAYFDLGNPPVALDSALVDAAVEVIRKSTELDIDDGITMDISPGAYGNNSLGANDGGGHPLNPATGQPYPAQVVKRGDFTRTLAEFWADGPKSETPPGHWNAIANSIADNASLERRLFGSGEVLDPLSWDVHVYLALDGALHDAAVAAWELKRKYTAARPITLIRYMGGLGQRSDPTLPSYHRDGLPLIDNLIELITADSTAPGQRHAHLSRYVGQIAVRSWRGEPGDRADDIGGVGWIRAMDWMPYQRRTFVTPAFPGYLSGHSTFSRAAATALARLTGSDFFPGGLGQYSCPPGYLVFEHGPSQAVTLQWATYFDASDQAGQSRLWGGIHIRQDDFDGRRIGALIGATAIERARTYFDGTAMP